nr:DUF1775 domain-containing protein [Paenibacillus larvae]
MTVSPNEAIQGSYQKFVVKVPTEKGIPTTQVKVKFDISNVKVSSFEPKPGWTYETAKDEQGNITGVTWKARGDGIKKNEFCGIQHAGKNCRQCGLHHLESLSDIFGWKYCRMDRS